ncbi:MAG: ABC transporter substrate-binding protein [Chloroflexi bacterium]|nr:ABC transporter substrate-binding protein [Chloroflexota bacterium]
MKKLLWLAVSILMVMSLVLAACGTAVTPTPPTTPATPTTPTAPTTPTTPTGPVTEKPQQEAVKPAAVAPKYGGTLTLARTTDITNWNPITELGVLVPWQLINERTWEGDWAKGPAGTNETDWGFYYDRWALNVGTMAESVTWTTDEANNQGTIVYKVRQGVHYAINTEPWAEAARLANGREVTADDLLYLQTKQTSLPRSYIYRTNIPLRQAKITKSGPWEVSVTVGLDDLVTAIARFGLTGGIVPPEVYEKYNMDDSKSSVGTGPFILKDNVPGSQIVLKRNPNYWDTDPVGPGKGNQLPYLDGVRYLIIPDTSTIQAALRTAKIDNYSFGWEDADQVLKTQPKLLRKENAIGHGGQIQIRQDRPPFKDLRVRRALMMATDFQAIHDGLNQGIGQIQTWPFALTPGYEDMYISIDDPQIPDSTRELYKYNPEKAKALLKEAGYPNGFKATALVTSTEVDYFSIMKDMWSKVGIELVLDVKESGTKSSIQDKHEQPELSTWGGDPIAIFHSPPTLEGSGANMAELKDPVIHAATAAARKAVVTSGEDEAFRIMKELTKHLLAQAYAIPRPKRGNSVLWWPWLKNYNGEWAQGYAGLWPKHIWYDADLKKSMGY